MAGRGNNMSAHVGPRNYAQERLTAIARGETGAGHNSKDAIRHRARRLMEKKLGHKLPTSVQVDHKHPLKYGVSSDVNRTSNLRVESVRKNESDGGKIGSSKGKAAGARKGHRLPVRKP